jgi:hypothetical protein
MKRSFATTSAVAFAIVGLAAACSSTGISAGNDHLVGDFTTGWACACPNGATTCSLSCPDGTQGSCVGGEPYCDVTQADAGLACACPNGGTSCSITCPNGNPGQCANGVPTCGGGTGDGGTCCPAGWDLYACTYPNGGNGQACHNPALGCASSLTCGQGCDPVVTGRCGGTDAGPALQWYTSCGYPVCGNPNGGPDDAGDTTDSGAACPTEGTPCSVAGDTCGTPSQANCGVVMVCAASDPKKGFGGCPISTRKYKDGIEYVSDSALQQLHDETIGIRLATYRYKPQVADPGPTHFGFIIEDNLQTPAVDPMHDRVDMYGYVSMVVAAMQVQEREIAELRAQVKACSGGSSMETPVKK